MADPSQPALDPATVATLDKLADIVSPQAVSWLPQTWGWAVLGVAILAFAAWAAWRARQRRVANRYRTEAIAQIDALEAKLHDSHARAGSLLAMAPIVKRAALAAWPRQEVAGLSGEAWVAFLRAHGELPEGALRLLVDGEYRPVEALSAMSETDARACARALRTWVKEHRVSA